MLQIRSSLRSSTDPFGTFADCGSSLFTELELMPDVVCIKSGQMDDKSARDYAVGVEFYVKDRLNFCKAVEDAKQVHQFG